MGLTNTGIDEMASLAVGGAGTPFNSTNARIAIGSGATAFAKTQTTLVTELASGRKLATVTGPTGTSGAKTVQLVAAFNNGEAEGVWAEWGVFNAGAAGVMLCRATSTMGTKAAGQVWTVTATLTFASGN
jgi:hypothetical protein